MDIRLYWLAGGLFILEIILAILNTVWAALPPTAIVIILVYCYYCENGTCK